MNYLKSITIILLLIYTSSVYSQKVATLVDSYKIGKNKVEVYFFDPFINISNQPSEFQDASDSLKSKILDNYLHNSTLYIFRTTNKKTQEVTNYRITGNPELTRSKMYFKVDVFENASSKVEELPKSTSPTRTINKVNCGGTLFEHMSLFDEPSRKKYIGNGIQLFGYYRRVQPYSEIQKSMNYLIENDQK